MSDFTFVPITWSTSPSTLDKQYQQLRMKVEKHQPNAVVIIGIPRHHAKKVSQQDWTKDYFISKEQRACTDGRKTKVCTVIYSKYPFTSEEWITSGGNVTHVAQVCVPIGAWKAHRSPLEVLQECGWTYDEISTLTFAATTDGTDLPRIKQAFDPDKIRNTVIACGPPETSVRGGWWTYENRESDEGAYHLQSEPLFVTSREEDVNATDSSTAN